MNKLHNLSGENPDQLLILTDEKGNQIGTATRLVCHSGIGKTHLAFMAFVIVPPGEILLTQRSKNKSLWPLHWDASTISHVLPGETVEKAANRRGREELGIDVEFKDLGAFFYKKRQGENSENEYCHVLIGKSGGKTDFNPAEIEEIRNISIGGLKKEIREKPDIFTPWLKLALEKFKLNE